MMSVETERPGMISAGHGQLLRVLGRCCSHDAWPPGSDPSPTGAGRWSCSQTAGVSAIAAATSVRKSAGCGLVNRTRRIPSTASTCRSSSAKRDGASRRGPGRGRRCRRSARGGSPRRRPRPRDRSTSLRMSPGRRLTLRTPRTDGHDAEGAAVVAPDLDRDPGRVLQLSLHREGGGHRLELIGDLGDRRPRPGHGR